MKFRKKPVVIEAVRWEGNNWDEIVEFSPYGITHSSKEDALIIATLEGEMKAQLGDWIIKGIKGEYYPCKPEIFNATYEKVED